VSPVARVAFVNPFAGASGDMFLGALVDLGVEAAALEAALRRLPLPGLRIEARQVERGGLRATQVTPAFPGRAPSFRTLGQVKEALHAGAIEPEVGRAAERAFERLAAAEAGVHGGTAGTVHFHELGSADTLVDVVGAIWGWRALGITRAFAGPVNLGAGTVRTAHGAFPVPAPATAALLAGRAVFSDGEEGEKTTPTGALLLTELCEPGGSLPPFDLERTGYGAGERSFEARPNCLPILLGRACPEGEGEEVVVLETNVDDVSPQVLAYVIERLLRAGAREAFVTPVVMKKGRAGHLVTAVAPVGREGDLGALLVRETGTLGYRLRRVDRVALRREEREVAVAGGTVRVKTASLGGAPVRFGPEYEDCRRIAERTGRPLREVIAEVLREGGRTP